MANRSSEEREMIQQDTEADKDSIRTESNKASHGNSRGELQDNNKMDFDLTDDIDSIEER